MQLRRRSTAATAALTLCLAVNADALVPPSSPAAEKAFRHPDLYVPPSLVPVGALPEDAAAAAGSDLAALGVGHEGAFFDRRAGRLSSFILSVPLIPGAGNALQWPGAAPADDARIGEAARAALLEYLERNAAALRVDLEQLGTVSVTVHGGGWLVQMWAPRVVDDVPVRDSVLSAVVNHGNLVLLGLDHWGQVAPATALIGADQARAAAAQHAQPLALAADRTARSARLEYVPMARGDAYDFRLAWVVPVAIEGDLGTWEGVVDAGTGELLAFEDRNQYAARRIVGGVFPVSNDGVLPDGVEQAGWPMPYTDVVTGAGTITANSAGVIGCPTGAISTTLTGRYTRILDACGAVNETSAAGDLDLGASAGTNCTVPAGHSAGDTHSARTGMYELTRLNEHARSYLPNNAWLNSQLTSNMNINLNCNAFWNGVTVNFYRQGSGCGNTGEIAAIFDHEWGHGIDNNHGNTAISSPGEAIADIHAFLRLNTSCIGRGFSLTGPCGGYGDACLSCTGVRDIDFAQHASGNPHTLAFAQACPAVGTRGPCNRETHCEGMVPAEVGFDLVRRDLPALFGLDLNTSLELGARLFFAGAGPVTNWYQCVAGTAGCPATSGYLNLLAADDDNGNLSDGTPHMTAIFGAFNRHGIACATPAVQNSGCASGPTAAPVLSATAADQRVSLSWTAVANAVRYEVYQTEGANGDAFGKVKVGDVTGTTFLAENLQNGRTYYFTILPVGTTPACTGRMSNTATVVPVAGANLGIRPTVTVTVTGGDGDGILDNCEIASLGVTVDNTGTGALTNVRIVGVTPLTHPSSVVVTPLPVTLAASLADCATASGTVDVRALGMAFDQTTQFRIDITADQLGAQVRSVVATITGVESDWQATPSRTFSFETAGDLEGWQVVQGTWTQATVNAGANGTLRYVRSSTAADNACDVIRSPRVRTTATSALSLSTFFTIENVSGGIWYDRANVGVVNAATGAAAVVSPGTGRLYNASGGSGGCNGTQPGWAGTAASWAASGWSTANLNTPAGSVVRLEIRYATDFALSLNGFRFDEVTLTNFDRQVPDVQPDTCCAAITVNPATIPAGTAGSPYSQTFTQTGGVGTITWSVTGTLPTGVTLNPSTGVLSGTPTQTGSFPITVRATDANGCFGTRAVTLVINCQAIGVNPATIPAGTAGSPYSQTFTQTGGVGTITWSVTGTLPTGVTLNPTTGVLSGTPTQTGSFPITVRATDANGCFGTRAVTLVINCQTLTVNPATIPAGTAGTAYSATFTQAGGIGTITWSMTGALPAGLTLDPASGVLSGTPIQTGSFPITITATDANGCTGARAYTLVINCQTITVDPPTLPAGTAGVPYSETFTQTGGIGTITWSLTGSLPAGLTLDPSSGVLSGTPGQHGGFPFTITAFDANNCTGLRPYTLVIDRAGPFVPTALAVDVPGNRVFEPGETVEVAPSWRNDTGAPETVTGAASAYTGPAGATYTLVDGAATYGGVAPGDTADCATAGDCYQVAVSQPPSRPVLHWDATMVETLSSTDARTWTLHVGRTFTDVPPASGFYRFVETLVHRNVTGGCGGTSYCPANSTSREQMAVFVLVSKEPPGYLPPPCGATPMFPDVPVTSGFCRWVEELARRGVVGGCGGGNYCPASPATREQMAVFVLRTLDPALNPPPCGAPMFADVPASSGFCRWIEELARRGVVTGCGGGNYCPAAPVTREQMSVFLTVTFGLTLYGL